MSENQDLNKPRRAAVYIDGFNLYHPIHEYGENFLKWLDLWRLGEIMCQRHDTRLVKAVFCTAVPRDDPSKRDRHNTFNAVQTAKGVSVIKGHHVMDPKTGERSEKQSDINVALSLILDAHDGVYDYAYLLSADSDQAATARVFRERFPDLELCSVAPPNRPVSEKVASYADDHFVLNKLQIETCVMPMYVRGRSGKFIKRPDAYEPPEWWVHPDKRPRKR